MSEARDAVEPTTCPNCDAELDAGDNYCAECGQRNLPSRLALGELLREVASETVELDGRVARTALPFFFRPGFLTREYVRGRRAAYTSPFRLFLAATLLWVLSTTVAELRFGDEELARQGDEIHFDESVEPKTDVERWIVGVGEELAALPPEERARRASEAFREDLPRAALLMIPVFALLLQLSFAGTGRYYVEHLVFALHVHAFAFFIAAIAALFRDDLAGTLALLAVLAYAYVALWKAYEARWWTSALRLLLLFFVHSIVLGVTTGVFVLLSLAT